RLHNESARAKDLYDVAMKQLKSMEAVQDYGGYQEKTIAPPGYGGKIAPNGMLVFPMAAFFGILGGVGLCFLADMADQSFPKPEEIRRRLGLPVLGHVPFHMLEDDKLQEARANGIMFNPTLCSYYLPKSGAAEAYRGLRTALYFSTHGEGHKVIQVTSPDKGE